MKQIRIQNKGIKRNNPQGTDDSACDDLINMRFINNAWRPIAPKATLHPENTYTLQRIHVIDGVDDGNWIGYLDSTPGVIKYFIPSTGVVTQTIITLNATETLNDILFLKKIMTIVTDENAYKFYYKDGLYKQINLTGIESVFTVDLSKGKMNPDVSTDRTESSDASTPPPTFSEAELLANWVKFLNESSSDGYNYGGIFYRIALKMFDGSYILHTLPKYYQFDSNDVSLTWAYDGGLPYEYYFDLYTAKVLGSLKYTPSTLGDTTQFEGLKDFIQSVVVFASKAEGLFDLNEKSMTEENLWSIVPFADTPTLLSSQTVIGINPDFKKMADSVAWYQIGEVALNDLEDDAGLGYCDITLWGTFGTANISGIGSLTKLVTFDTSLTQTARNFISDYADEYLALGIQVTQNGGQLKFVNPNGTLDTGSMANVSGDLSFSLIIQSHYAAVSGDLWGDVEMDMDGFYTNYATRRTLPVDDFTHHDLTGNATYVYNNRLMFGDTLQTLALPYIMPFPKNDFIASPRIAVLIAIGLYVEYVWDALVTVKVEVKIDTDDGERIVIQDASWDSYKATTSATDKAIFLPNVIGYPDARAKEVVVYLWDDPDWRELLRVDLKKSTFYNYSYAYFDKFHRLATDDANVDPRYVNYNFASYPIQYVVATATIATLPTVNRLLVDNNRWATSEVNNPSLFKNVNSNQVGIGRILAFGTNTELIGVSQFGQFPIIIFMSTGRWIAEIGTGEVYITRIVPLDRDVIRDKDAKLDLAFGVVYITAEGLKIAQAKEVVVISESVDGLPDQNFIDNTDFIYFANNENTVQMIDYLDKVDFLTYLEDAILGYNKNFENSELIIANPNYYYAYVYDITSKTWYKFAEKISQFIPSYPNLYAMSEKRSGIIAPYSLTKRILNISSEVAGDTQCMIVTRALSMGLEDVFKKLHRTFVRGYFTTKTDAYAAAYIFASDDLKNWKFVTGNDANTGEFNNIWLTHSKGSSRYYIVVFLAELSVGSGIINRFNSIDIMFQEKRNQKLR